MIGVCGGSGSGKTTLARRLVAALGPDDATCISFDSYYRDHSELTIEQRAAINFDHPDSLDVDLLVEHLQSLRAGDDVAIPVYDFSTHTRSGHLDIVAPKQFVVIEGILLFAFPEIRDNLDYMIFRQCPSEIRAARRFRRDVEKRGRTPESVRAQWTQTVQPMHDIYVEPNAAYANLITTHGQDLDRLVTEIANALRQGGSLAVTNN
ncbi:MAG: uridine kinase [Acidimicrobiales bacterium]